MKTYKIDSYTYDVGENALMIIASSGEPHNEEVSITIKNPSVGTVMDLMHTYDGRYRSNRYAQIVLEGNVHD